MPDSILKINCQMVKYLFVSDTKGGVCEELRNKLLAENQVGVCGKHFFSVHYNAVILQSYYLSTLGG